MMATLMMQLIYEDGGRNVQSMHCQVAFAIHSDMRKKRYSICMIPPFFFMTGTLDRLLPRVITFKGEDAQLT